jgi:hypothetical protein
MPRRENYFQQHRPFSAGSGARLRRGSFGTRLCRLSRGQFFDQCVGNGRAIEDFPRGISHFGEDAPDFASRLGVTIGATPIGNPAQAWEGSDRPVNDSEDPPEGDLIRRHEQSVAAEPTPATGHNTVVLQVQKDLFQEFSRDALPIRDLGNHHRIVGAGKRHERPKRISCFL